MSRIFPDSDRTAGGGPVLSTAIFLFLCILKALMSAENAPVFGMLVRLQVNQHGPVGGLGVALGLFWARRTNLRGHIRLYRPLQHLSRPGGGPPILLILGSCARILYIYAAATSSRQVDGAPNRAWQTVQDLRFVICDLRSLISEK